MKKIFFALLVLVVPVLANPDGRYNATCSVAEKANKALWLVP